MTAAKNLQVIRTIQKSTNFALQAKGEFQLAGCQILLSKQFHCDLQNRHKPYIPLLPSWLPKKDVFGCFFFCWNPPNCLLLRKNCCWMRRPIFWGQHEGLQKPLKAGKAHLATKILLPDSNGNTAASRWPVTKACLCRRSDVTAFCFNQRLQFLFLHKLGFLWILSCFRWSISNLQKKAVYTGMSCSKWTISSI